MVNIIWVIVLLYFLIVLANAYIQACKREPEVFQDIVYERITHPIELLSKETIMRKDQMEYISPEYQAAMKEGELRDFAHKVVKQFAEWNESDPNDVFDPAYPDKRIKIQMRVVNTNKRI